MGKCCTKTSAELKEKELNLAESHRPIDSQRLNPPKEDIEEILEMSANYVDQVIVKTKIINE